MCGLVGFMGDPSQKHQDAFEDMLNMDVIRGPHSTGVVAVSQDRVFMTKKAVLPPDLMYSERYIENVDRRTYSNFLLMGHNRWATTGAVNNRNAHPFQHGHITLMHNGTLQWPIDYRQKFETDSEGIAYSLQQNEDPQDTWSELFGAAALVWWDSRKKTLNAIRNDERPLWFCPTKDNKSLFWSSEPWMLKAACARRNVEIDVNSCFQPLEDELYSFSWNKKDSKVTFENKRLKSSSLGRSLQSKRSDVCSSAEDWYEDQLWYETYGYGKSKPKRSGQSDKQSEGVRSEGDGHSDGTSKPSIQVGETTLVLNPKTLVYEKQEDGEEGNLLLGQDIPPKEKLHILRQYQKHSLTEEEFNQQYTCCPGCGETLEGQYDESVIIDKKIAVCPSCVSYCEDEGYNVDFVFKN